MDTTLLQEGAIIMAIGMGTVFLFLVIMIVAMDLNKIVLNFVGKYFPEEVPEVKTTKKKAAPNSNDEVAVAIACALHKSKKA